jgi:hypothetical protein
MKNLLLQTERNKFKFLVSNKMDDKILVQEADLEINVQKAKYMLLSHHQNAGQNQDIKTVNGLFENVSELKYLGTTVINQNLIQKEIKRRLNSGSACDHSAQKLLSSCLLSKNIK